MFPPHNRLPIPVIVGLPLLITASCLVSPASAATESGTTIIMEYPSRNEPLRKIYRITKPGERLGSRIQTKPGAVTLVIKNVNTILYDVEITGKKTKRFTLDAFLDLTKPAKAPNKAPAAVHKAVSFPEAVEEFFIRSQAFTTLAPIAHQRLSQVVLDSEKQNYPVTSVTPPYQDPSDYSERVGQRELITDLFDSSDLSDIKGAGEKRFADVDEAYKHVLDQYAKLTPGEQSGSNKILLEVCTKELERLSREKDSVIARYAGVAKLWGLMRDGEFTIEDDETIDLNSGEILTYSVKLTPRTSSALSSKPELAPITREFKLNARGGWEFDAAPGFFFSWGNLRDRTYGKRTIAGATRVSRIGTQDSFKASAGAMVHIHRQLAGDVDWGPSFGLSVKDGETVQYMGGLSLLLGRNQRIVVTAGVAGGRARRLDGVREGQIFTGEKIPTRDALQIGPFLGITYNFD